MVLFGFETTMPEVAAATPSTVTPSKATFLALYSSTPVACTWLLSLKVLLLTEPDAPREICMELAAVIGLA